MIKQNILTLYRSLITQGQRREAHWLALLYLTAGYDDEWRGNIDWIAKNNPYPFANWFPDGEDRVIIGFVRNYEDIIIPDSVETAFSQMLINIDIDDPEQIEDYIQGYCKDKHGRKAKIGKILNKSLSMQQKQLKKLMELPEDQREEIQIISVTNEIEIIQDALNEFLNDPNRSRAKETQYQIIISQNPHDVARSSYDRNWESCFDIGSHPGDPDAGSNAQTVFCEVRDGGMVAYLTKPDDNEIEEPYARILIRRFMGKDGTNIALAEQTVYGDEIPGFQEAVDKWLEEHNAQVIPGRYKRLGGEYSDTYGDEHYVSPKEESAMLKWMKADFDTEAETITWIVFDKDYDILGEEGFWSYHDPFSTKIEFMEERSDWYDEWHSEEDGTKKFDSEIEARRFLEQLQRYGDAEDYMRIKMRHEGYDYEDIEALDSDEWEEKYDAFIEERFSIEPYTNNHTRQLQKSVVERIAKERKDYGPELLQAAKAFIFDYYKHTAAGIPMEFFRLYPDSLTKEEFLKINATLAQKVLNSDYLSDEKRAEFEQIGKEAFKSYLNFNAIIERATRSGSSSWISSLRKSPMSSKELMSDAIYYRFSDALRDASKYVTTYGKEEKEHLLNMSKEITIDDRILNKDAIKMQKSILHELVINAKVTPDELYPIVRELMNFYEPDRIIENRTPGVTLLDVGYYVAAMGPNPKYAQEFLPEFVRQLDKLEEYIDRELQPDYLAAPEGSYREKMVAEKKNRAMENGRSRLMYVIDCLSNGKSRSTKYKWIN